MRWLIALGVVLIVFAMIFQGDKKKDVDKRMKELRTIKKRKAKERAEQNRREMKIAS